MNMEKIKFEVEVEENDYTVIEKTFENKDEANDFYDKYFSKYSDLEYESEDTDDEVRCIVYLFEIDEDGYRDLTCSESFYVDFDLL